MKTKRASKRRGKVPAISEIFEKLLAIKMSDSVVNYQKGTVGSLLTRNL